MNPAETSEYIRRLRTYEATLEQKDAASDLLNLALTRIRIDLLEDITNQPENRDVLLAQLDVLVKLGDKLSGQL